MAVWSCCDLRDPARVPRSAGNLAGCARRRAGSFARDLSGLGFRTPPTSGPDPGSSARLRGASERSGAPPAWRSRDDDRRARPHPPERGSRWTACRHLRHTHDVPPPPSTGDPRQRTGVSAAPLQKDGSGGRSANAAHLVDDSAISEFPKWRKYLISLSFRGQSSVRPVQVGGFDVNIVIHRSTAVRGRGGPARHDAWPPSLGAILAHTDGPCGS